MLVVLIDSIVSKFYIIKLSNQVVFNDLTVPAYKLNDYFLSQCKNLNKNSVFLILNIDHSFSR